MKKIVLLVALCLCVGNLFAQDADKLRDEGDAALKAKDYATVVTKYGEYLKQIAAYPQLKTRPVSSIADTPLIKRRTTPRPPSISTWPLR